MRRLIVATVSVVALLVGVVAVTAGPASAATNITATFVALGEGADCSYGTLDVGFQSTVVDTQHGMATNPAGDVLGSFTLPMAGYDDFDGVIEDYGIPFPANEQPEGTIIGSYAAVGTDPFSSDSAAEWFVLYRCSDAPGGSEVLFTCYGDYGTCPQTAAEAMDGFTGSLSATSVAPGATVTVSGSGCYDQLVGALLLKDGEATGVGDVVAPGFGGSYSVDLTVPANATPGAYEVLVECGSEEGGVEDWLTLPLQVVASPTTTPIGGSGSGRSGGGSGSGQVTPTFTG